MPFDDSTFAYAFLVGSVLGYLAVLLFLAADEIDPDDHEF